MKENTREYARLQYKVGKHADGTVAAPKVWLMTRTLHKICEIHPCEELTVTAKLNEANTCSLTLYRTSNGIELPHWDKIKDLSVILIEGFGLFEIKVTVTENAATAKKITGQSLQECELGQTYGSWEINTADDIEAKKDYQDCATVFYRNLSESATEKEKAERRDTSLIHRILSYAPHYAIGHIDKSLWNISREFTASNTTVYDFLQTVSNEAGCIFLFDPFARTLNAFDMEDHCTNPDCTDRRRIFAGVCQGCHSSEFIEKGYGKDITTYIDTANIATELEDTVNADSIKNCIRIQGGDDAITNQIGQRLIGNSNCIWTFSEEQLAEMSPALQEKWKEYATFLNTRREESNASYQEEFNACWDEYNQVISDKIYEESGKMPLLEMPPTEEGSPYYGADLTEACKDIYDNIITPHITYGCINRKDTTLEKLSENILNYAKLLMPLGFGIEFQKTGEHDDTKCDRDPSDNAITTWYGKMYVYVLNDVDEKTGENRYSYAHPEYWTLPVVAGYKVFSGEDNKVFSHSYYQWMKQQLDIQLMDNNKNRFQPKYDTDYADSTSDHSNKADYYTKYFAGYGLNRLKSFSSAYGDKCAIIIGNQMSKYSNSEIQDKYHYIMKDGTESKKTMYDDLMEKYLAFKTCIDILIHESENLINGYQARIDTLLEKIEKINQACSPEAYFGDLYKELMMFKRENIYENSYLTSDVPEDELIPNIETLIQSARQEAAKACQSNHSVSLSLGNLLSADGFSEQIDHISLGSYVRTRVQGVLSKMRIIETSFHFDNMETSEITFSDAIVGYQPIKEVRDKLEKAASMATSFDFTARQSSKNEKEVCKFNEMFQDGLNAANTLIKSNDREEFLIDNYGILGRQYDRDADQYDSCQLRISHNIIGFTKDNWDHLSMAIGKITWNNESMYGVIADALIGKMVLGNRLVISNEGGDYTMDDRGFRIEKDNSKIVLDGKNASFLIEKDGEMQLCYPYEEGLYIHGKGLFTGEIKVGDNFIVNDKGEMTCIEGNFTGKIDSATITGSKIEIGDKKFLVDKTGNAIVNIVGGNININTEYGEGNQIRLNYKVENSPEHLTLKSSLMMEDIIGVEREYQTLDETLKPGIYLELESSNQYPGIYATALMPNKDNVLKKLEGRIKFKGDAIIENNVRVKEYGYFSSDAPFYAPNIKSDSTTVHITSPDHRFHTDVELHLPKPPKVVVTPITDNPVTVKASVSNITKNGFTIYAYCADTIGDIEVHWIAMY